jgi:Kdo2-lipid IVA lauroyltransferase/acyltransferase
LRHAARDGRRTQVQCSRVAKKRKFKVPRILEVPATAAIRGAISLPLIAGPTVSRELAAAAARFWAERRMNRKRLQRGIDHLVEAFPSWDVDQRRELAIKAYEHLFMLGTEIAFAPRLFTDQGWTKHLKLADLSPAVHALVGDNPCILLSGHVGNWELIGYSIPLLGFRMYAVYRPFDMRPLDDWVWNTRARRGLILVSKFGAMKVLPEALKGGEPVALVADQNGGDRGAFVPFFGRLCSTYKSLGLLALQSKSTIVCGFARRMPQDELRRVAARTPDSDFGSRGSMGYTAEVVDVFGPDDWNTHPDPLYYICARYRRAMEVMIRRAPEQYLWMHRAWRARPPHEKQNKPFPPSLREKLALLPWMTSAELAAIEDRSARDAAAIGV